MVPAKIPDERADVNSRLSLNACVSPGPAVSVHLPTDYGAALATFANDALVRLVAAPYSVFKLAIAFRQFCGDNVGPAGKFR